MPITLEQLKKTLLHRVATQPREFATRTVHMLERPLSGGTKLHIGPNQHEISREAFLVVIDEAPGAYWTHPVRYELHDVATGEVRVIPEQYPLELPDVKAELIALHIPDLPHLKKTKDDFFELRQLKLADFAKVLATRSYALPPQSSKRHALFIAGMDNMPDFHNDFVIMRDILIDSYGYDPDNIIIAMGNGTGYVDLPVKYAGNAAGIDAALAAFAAGGSHALGHDDCLFLYTFNHGGFDGTHAYLCLPPSWGSYYDYQLKAKLDNIHCRQLIVAMNQCHSGGFINEVIATTGPADIAIMTACREDQSAYPSAGSNHGYFSVVLAAALNWGFPAGVVSTFPGFTAGDISSQDSNNDGLVCAEEAFNYVNTTMAAHHWATINGIETPQWGVSSPGVGITLFWGLPELVVEDGTPWFESPDVYLHDPTVVPSDATVDTAADWHDYYHPDAVNRIVARVHNRGCAPARNISVEFRTMSFGTGGGTNLAGIFSLANLNPGHHDFAWADWNFSASLVHRCAMARATCAGDVAAPFGASIVVDDHQAQRNLDPLFALPHLKAPQFFERNFVIHNPFEEKATFALMPAKPKLRAARISHVLAEAEALKKIVLEARKSRQVTMRFEVAPDAERGEKLHLPVEFRRADGGPPIGGVVFTLEVAEGRLEGHLFNPGRALPRKGTVRIENLKQTDLYYETELNSRGTFSFPLIVPGPYRIIGDCGTMAGNSSVFVSPNRITTKALLVEARRIAVVEAPKIKKAEAA